MANFYYRDQEGSAIGPVTGIELREAAFAGKIRLKTQVRTETGKQWASAEQVRGLFGPDGTVLPHPPETQRFLASGMPTDPEGFDSVEDLSLQEPKRRRDSASEPGSNRTSSPAAVRPRATHRPARSRPAEKKHSRLWTRVRNLILVIAATVALYLASPYLLSAILYPSPRGLRAETRGWRHVRLRVIDTLYGDDAVAQEIIRTFETDSDEPR